MDSLRHLHFTWLYLLWELLSSLLGPNSSLLGPNTSLLGPNSTLLGPNSSQKHLCVWRECRFTWDHSFRGNSPPWWGRYGGWCDLIYGGRRGLLIWCWVGGRTLMTQPEAEAILKACPEDRWLSLLEDRPQSQRFPQPSNTSSPSAGNQIPRLMCLWGNVHVQTGRAFLHIRLVHAQ